MQLVNILPFLFIFSFLNMLTAQETLNESLMHDGLEREYILYVPESYNPDTPTPLVICFHGYGSNAATNFFYTNFRSIADTAGFILIHPQGTLLEGTTHWNVGGWTLASTVDDVSFTAAMLDKVISEYNINEERIYSTGMSNGGYMSFLLACQLSDRIAAIASVTGSMTIQTFADCNPQHPTPILQIHGTADEVVPYEGDPFWTEAIEDVLDYWVSYNQCNTTAEVTPLPDLVVSDNSTVEHWVYDNGNDNVNTEHFKVLGGGHDWPNAFGNMDMNSSEEVWQFFARYDINGLIENTTVDVENIKNQYQLVEVYPNPVKNTMTIAVNEVNKQPFRIYNIVGKLVLEGKINSQEQQLDPSALTSGVYLMNVGTQTIRFIKG
ncbi:MAG: T9SS type A sorting domain-containing protein [Bacteroidota bacterium]